MSFLARFRILTKILSVIAILSGIATLITVVGVNALSDLNDMTDRMDRVATNALVAQRASVNLIAMNRAEFRVAVDPGEQNRREARQQLDNEKKAFNDRLTELRKIAGASITVKKHLPAVEKAWADYERELESTAKVVQSIKNFEMSAEATRLRDTVVASTAAAETLRASLGAMSRELDKRVGELSSEATVEYEQTARMMIVIAGIGIAAGLGIGFFIGQFGIAKPIRNVVALLQRLANGDFNIEVAGTERKDEVGDVAKTAVVFKDNGLAKLRMEAEQKETEARAAAQRKAEMMQLADSFEAAVGSIIGTVSSASTQLEAAANTLTQTAEMTQQLSTTVAAASEEASANVQSVASATEELSGSVGEIGRQVQESSRIANEAVSQAQKTDARITELQQAASRIGDVVKLITAIAEQTNLLALNATIEAARAGEAGRGFAVVAQEVKALAAQTAKATDEIGSQIAGMQTVTQDSVTAIKEIGATIDRMSEIAGAIAAAVEEQGAATQEIARNVQNAASGTTEVANNIGAVNKGAGETGSASAQVLASAQSLSADSQRLKAEVERFLATVRAA